MHGKLPIRAVYMLFAHCVHRVMCVLLRESKENVLLVLFAAASSSTVAADATVAATATASAAVAVSLHTYYFLMEIHSRYYYGCCFVFPLPIFLFHSLLIRLGYFSFEPGPAAHHTQSVQLNRHLVLIGIYTQLHTVFIAFS